MEYSPYLVYVIVSLETLKISDLPCPSDNTGCQCQDLQQSIDKVVGPTMHNLQIFAIILLLRKECGLPNFDLLTSYYISQHAAPWNYIQYIALSMLTNNVLPHFYSEDAGAKRVMNIKTLPDLLYLKLSI